MLTCSQSTQYESHRKTGSTKQKQNYFYHTYREDEIWELMKNHTSVSLRKTEMGNVSLGKKYNKHGSIILSFKRNM